MKISLFIKTFLLLLLSFSLVFVVSNYVSRQRFLPLYIEENINNVKTSILSNTDKIESGTSLSDTSLMNLSSETSFILYTNNGIKESVGSVTLDESSVLLFVIDLYDQSNAKKEGNLLYHTTLVDDIYHINYIYQFELDTYLIIQTRIQSLRNIDTVLNQINVTEGLFFFIMIAILSLIISYGITKPIKKITTYATELSKLNFQSKLKLKRKDEFQTLITALNEMTHNLKVSYQSLDEANQKLEKDIIYEKRQEEKKKALIHMINHELRTPLSVMKGMIEGMIDGVGRYKDKDKYLNELLNQIDAIESLTRDLTYSLKLEDKIKPNDICDTKLAIDQLDSLFELAKQKGVKITSRFKQTVLEMNEELFVLLLKNLLKNAIVYTKNNEVSLIGENNGAYFCLTIRNQGHLNDDELNDLFLPFYRGKTEKDNEKGTGLGLSIVKQICELYDLNLTLFNDGSDVVARVNIPRKMIEMSSL
ncbi:MAG TPA: hypothetical protein DEA45_02500 [Acholeplasmataceae bacterium]|nr:hypothetical protein [Acholeplasmataceae bacterium]